MLTSTRYQCCSLMLSYFETTLIKICIYIYIIYLTEVILPEHTPVGADPCIKISIWDRLPSQFRIFPIEPCHLHFFLNLRLLFLAVLESGAPLSSSLEEALYKC